MTRDQIRLSVRRALGLPDAVDAPEIDAHVTALLDEGWVAPLTIAKMVAARLGLSKR